MTKMREAVLVVVLAASTAACGAAHEDAVRERESAAPGQAAAAPASDAGTAGGERPVLTDALLERWVEAARNVEDAKAADPEVEELASIRGDISIGENAEAWDRVPVLRGAVERAGLTSREYLAIGSEIVGAFLADATIGEEALKAEPEVTQRNVAFVRAHQARIQAAMESMRRGE